MSAQQVAWGAPFAIKLTPKGSHLPWPLVVVGVVVGPFLSLQNSLIAGTALLSLQGEVTGNIYDLEWVGTAGQIAIAVGVLPAAWLAGRFGIRRTIVACQILYAIGSAGCAFAPDLATLILFRVVQGVPGGITPVVCVMALNHLVVKEKRVLAFSFYGAGVVCAPATTPLLGGAAVEHFEWRMVFISSLPLALLGLLLAVIILPPIPPTHRAPFDLLGFILSGGGMAVFISAVSKGQEWGWSSYRTLTMLCGGVNLIGLFLVVEMARRNPLLQLRLFGRKSFGVSLIVVTVIFGNVLTVLTSIPTFLGQAQGTTPILAGEVLLPAGLVWVMTMPLGGYLFRRCGARWPVFCGLLIVGATTMQLRLVNVDLPRTSISLILVAWSVGVGLTLIPTLAHTVAGLPDELGSHGLVGRTVAQKGTSILIVMLAADLRQRQQIQYLADRFSLMPIGTSNGSSTIANIRAQGTGALMQLWQQLQHQSLAWTLGGVFTLIGAVTIATGLLVLVSGWGKALSNAGSPAGAEQVTMTSRRGAALTH